MATMRRKHVFTAFALALALAFASNNVAVGETLSLSDVAVRTLLFFSVPADALKEKLPAPWQVGPVPA